MEYWIYHDKVTRTARLHISTCGACKNGKGMHGHQKADENEWYKFTSKHLAIEAAKKLNIKQPLMYCGLCKP